MRIILFAILLLTIGACDHHLDAPTEGVDEFQGSWILTERGYSPGAGYITEQVPQQPPQTVTFATERRFSSNMDGLRDFRFYLVVKDSSTNSTSIQLFTNDPNAQPAEPGNPPKFYVTFEGSLLKLMQVGCIEGCHLGFKRVGETRE